MVTSTTVTTQCITKHSEYEENSSSLDISCKNPEQSESKSVTWDPDTIDNEHLNRKSSKSCCIFTGKKHSHNDSSSDDDSDNESPKSDDKSKKGSDNPL